MLSIPKTYNPQEVEDKIYKEWEESGKFNPDNLDLPKNAKTFSVAMPPPNVTGILHLGHALENTLMDTMIRFQRMRGKKALLVPGTDHAAVATQAKVESDLVKSGKNKNPRQELGREKLLEIIRDYAEKSKATILSQIRKMGTSCDWSRLAYTFDEKRSKAVNEIFTRMYRNSLIYRGYRVVNWSVKGQSTCSDEELVYVERPAKLYTFKYSNDFPILIASTRPETKLGDTAVAVNPKDKRYKKYIGKTFTVDIGAVEPLQIKIIADKNVDPNFGTGALGVTPAHSMVDFEMAEKNKLPVIKVIGENGKMTAEAGKNYAGLTVYEAREKFVEYLKKERLLEREEDIQQNVGTSDRFGDVVEVLPMTQWFIDVNKKIPGRKKSLKNLMREAVTIGHNVKARQKINITPDRFGKIYLNWIDNLKDWCISRQIWWGHRIPVWYCMRCCGNSDLIIYLKWPGVKIKELSSVVLITTKQLRTEFIKQYPNDWREKIEKIKIEKLDRDNIIISGNRPKICPKCNCNDLVHDPDTLDTWFSSGLWTFSTLGWPDKTEDLKEFHPTSWMQMGSELVFFWMARMILMSTYAVDQIPFKNVYIHGILRDKTGRKFSKSLGNGINPLEIIKKYGTDALRLSLIIGTTPGNDARFYEEKVEGYRNYINKLWNISRYILTAVDSNELKNIKDANIRKINKKHLTLADRWILGKVGAVIDSSGKNLAKFNFSAAGEEITRFMRDDFADWYLEIAKAEIRNFEKNRKIKNIIFVFCLRSLLKILHPFIPFATEEIWGKFNSTMLMAEKWPEFIFNSDSPRFGKAGARDIADFNSIKSLIGSIRNLRSENKIDPALKIKAIFVARGKRAKDLIESQKEVIKSLARLESFRIESKKVGVEKSAVSFAAAADIYLPLEGVIDIRKELERLEKEMKENEKAAALLAERLGNKNFLAKAKKEVLEETKRKLKNSADAVSRLKERKRQLS